MNDYEYDLHRDRVREWSDEGEHDFHDDECECDDCLFLQLESDLIDHIEEHYYPDGKAVAEAYCKIGFDRTKEVDGELVNCDWECKRWDKHERFFELAKKLYGETKPKGEKK